MRKAVSTKGFIVNCVVNVLRQKLANGIRNINVRSFKSAQIRVARKVLTAGGGQSDYAQEFFDTQLTLKLEA
jgi:hypothetical protein